MIRWRKSLRSKGQGMQEAHSRPVGDDAHTSVPELSGLSLDLLLRSEASLHSALTAALRRVVSDMRRPGESYAEHGSTP